MNSIRRNLLQTLLIGIVLIASATGFLVYRHVRAEIDELYNAHLRQIATLMAREWEHSPPAQSGTVSIHTPDKRHWEEEDYLIQLWRRDGALVTEEMPVATRVRIPLAAAPGMQRRRIGGHSWRIYRADSGHVIVQIAQPEQARYPTVNETSAQLLVPLLLQVPLLALLIWFGVRRGLQPLDTLSAAIAQRRPHALSALDNAGQPRELQPLVTTLNDLLARLDAALQQQRDFVADAAHELRTPIAALQLQLDLLQRADSPEEREQSIAQLRSGLQRATHLTQQLLSIARAESAAQTSARDPVDTAALIESVVERHLPLARARQQDLGVTRLDAIAMQCARADIETVLDNLVGNAIRYTPRGGRIDLAVYRDGAAAVFEVTDTGPGIPIAERARIFDRFHRVLQKAPASETSESVAGSGLGLAIVKAVCDRCGAAVGVGAGVDGRGTRFSVRWPLV